MAEQFLLRQVNQHRAEKGVPPLAWDAALARAAHAHATRIAQEGGEAEHQYPGEPDPKQRAEEAGAHFSVVSENVAGNATSPGQLDQAWMNSPVHRANILDPQLNAVGIAVVQRDGVLYGVEDFARSVPVLDAGQVERQAGQALQNQGIRVISEPEKQQAARRLCEDQKGAAPGGAVLVMQWDGSDLSQLPAALARQMPAGSHAVALGACPSERQGEGFTTYHLAVVVY